MRASVGQILINESLPDDMQDFTRVLDKAGLKTLLREVYEKHPEHYRETVQKLTVLGADASLSEAHSVSVASFKSPAGKAAIVQRMREAAEKAYRTSALGDKDPNQAVIEAVAPFLDEFKKATMDDAVATGNPLGLQVSSGARGNATSLNSIIGSDVLYVDAQNRPIPMPIERSYAEGLSPAEYWAGSYGARKGTVDVKLATAKAGFFGKQISQASHRLVVSEKDCKTTTGLPVDVADKDNIGAILFKPAGDYAAGTPITGRMLNSLKESGVKEIQSRSVLTCRAKQGVCAVCAGIRSNGRLPNIGDHVGIQAAQALSERLSQGQLGSKHSGGVLGAAQSVSGFDLINQLVQVPDAFKDGAAVADLDGHVTAVEDAPQGGKYVNIGKVKHWVPPALTLRVKIGDVVEAGDVLSDGVPNPASIVAHKGIGEGRRYFVQEFQKAFKDSGMPAHRRNVELVARGLINHVRITGEDAGDMTVPDDLVEYDPMAARYQPRTGAKSLKPNLAVGRYLEQPALHFSIGTRVTPSVIKRLQAHNVGDVTVHDDEPNFQPEMHRAMENLTVSPDWQERLSGFYLGRGLQSATQRGSMSTTESTSYIPRVAQGKPLFGAEQAARISPVL